MEFLFPIHYPKRLVKRGRGLKPVLQSTVPAFAGGAPPAPLTAGWLITYAVIAYQKWQVFTGRAAAYYKQKPHAPSILVIKTNKPVPLSGRGKKKSWFQTSLFPTMSSKPLTGTNGNFSRNIRICWEEVKIVSHWTISKVLQDSRVVAKRWTQRKRPNTRNIRRGAARLSSWSRTQTTATAPQETSDSSLENRGSRPLHQTVALAFPKAEGVFWPDELRVETNNDKTAWNFAGGAERELSKSWGTSPHQHPSAGVHPFSQNALFE